MRKINIFFIFSQTKQIHLFFSCWVRWGRDLNPCSVNTNGFRDRRRSPGLATPATDKLVKSLIKAFFIWISIQVKIKVKLSRINKIKEVNLEKGSTIEDLLKKINLKPDTLIVMNKDKPIPIDDNLNDSQELTIIQVSSGG